MTAASWRWTASAASCLRSASSDHYRINWTWQIAELFKIEDGQIRRIEAVFQRAPFGIPSGWSTWEQSMSEEPQDVR